MEQCKVIAITNQKGGVGKTTTTVNLGVGLAKHGKRVLLIDADPQGSLTISLGERNPDQLSETLSDVMERIINDKSLPENFGLMRSAEGIDLMPANIELSGTEVGLFNVMSREYVLKSYIDSVSKNYDYILIDCPPSLGLLTLNALTSADFLIIPVQAQFLAMRGMAKITNVVGIVKERLNPNLNIGGIVITQFDKRKTLNKSVAELISESFCDKVFKTVIRDNVSLAEAPIKGMNIFEYNKNSNGAKDYMELAKEVLKLK